ncbi:MAG: FAD-binding protein [Duodenibacillus sp.]|nr:FAD-binding protein [Duodenibacillus sp.]
MGAVAAGASVSASAADQAPKSSTYDIVIIGAGMGGLTCAVRAAQIGLKPILIEKMGAPAGNTVYAAGFMLAVQSKPQIEKGSNKDDSVEKFYQDMLAVSKGRGDKALSRYMVEHADETMNWLVDFVGMKFNAGLKLAYPMLTRALLPMGDVRPGGKQLAQWLMAKAMKLGVKMQFNTKVVELLTDENTGAVTGVLARGKQGAERIYGELGTVIATGGYSANSAMVTQYCGVSAANMPIRGSRIIAGENLVLTQKVFAKAVNVDQYHCGPIHGPTGANPLNIVNNGVCVSVDKTERFTDEGLTYVQMSRDCAAKTKGNWAMMIIDQDTRDLKKLANDFESYSRSKAPVYQADTIADLAKAAGLNPEKLVKVIDEYNKALDANTRGQLVPPNTLPQARPVKKAPFYAIPFQGGMTATFGGPLINTRAQVIDTEGRVIPGLYAIGNAAGGLFYDDYIGGAQLTSAAVFGLAVADFLKAKKA